EGARAGSRWPFAAARPGLDRLTNDLQDFLALAANQRQARGADRFGAVAALRRRQLDVLHQLDVRIEVQQRREPTVNRPRLLVATAGGKVPQQTALLRKGIDQSRHPADRPEEDTF